MAYSATRTFERSLKAYRAELAKHTKAEATRPACPACGHRPAPGMYREAILVVLRHHRGGVVSRAEIDRLVRLLLQWPARDYDPASDRVVDVQISNLRKAGHAIESIRGQGYRLA